MTDKASEPHPYPAGLQAWNEASAEDTEDEPGEPKAFERALKHEAGAQGLDIDALLKDAGANLPEEFPGEPESEPLEGCPFCGGKAYLHTHYHAIAWHGKCYGCGVEGPCAQGDDGIESQKVEATRLWNERAELEADRDQMRAELEGFKDEYSAVETFLEEAQARIAKLEAEIGELEEGQDALSCRLLERIDELEAASEWHRVEDGLPEYIKGRTCSALLFVANTSGKVFEARCYADGPKYHWRDLRNEFHENVTHWCKRPEPPK